MSFCGVLSVVISRSSAVRGRLYSCIFLGLCAVMVHHMRLVSGGSSQESGPTGYQEIHRSLDSVRVQVADQSAGHRGRRPRSLDAPSQVQTRGRVPLWVSAISRALLLMRTTTCVFWSTGGRRNPRPAQPQGRLRAPCNGTRSNVRTGFLVLYPS